MKIRFAIVRPDILKQVRAEVDMLQSAVSAGDMDGVDAATAKLLAWTAECQSVDLPEEEWRAFLNGIRSRYPAFQSNYLLPGEICAEILPTVAANDFVLELPIDGESEKEDTDV
jgi:hypothetical protein